MFRATQPIALLMVMGLLVLTGCEDPKVRISQLEESNQLLLDQLQQAEGELMACRGANDNCQQELALARTEVDTAPVEEVPDGWQAVPGGAMIAIEGSVLFNSGKTQLRNSARTSLDQVVNALRSEYSDKEILVFGHTDDQPIKRSGWKDNFQLSTERALAVVRFLHGRGISPDRLAACGAGEFRPRVPNTSADNRQQNRRVEIFALDVAVQTALR